MKGNTIFLFLEALKQKQSPSELGDADHKWPLERKATKQHSESTSETKNYATLSKEQESYHGIRGSRIFNKSSAVCRRWLEDALLTLWTPWYNKPNHPSRPRCFTSLFQKNSGCHKWKHSMVSRIQSIISTLTKTKWSCMGIKIRYDAGLFLSAQPWPGLIGFPHHQSPHSENYLLCSCLTSLGPGRIESRVITY